MISAMAALHTVCILLTVSGAALSVPEDPCAIGKLSLAIESEDVLETCGEKLVLESLQREPAILRYEQADTSKKYTLLMVDPDVPNSTVPVNKFFLHWLLENVPGAELKSGDIIKGEDETPSYVERMSYYPPNPPKSSGPHRYQFFVYQQSKASLAGVPDKARSGFNVDDFVSDNSLGSPLAAFEYKAEKSPDSEL